MAKNDQVLVLEPSTELKFKGPYTTVVTSELKLTNPSQKRVLFKVKTTAPKCYCVRPNSGLIEPGGYAVVSVMLQPFDHASTEKSKHKFMVQSMFAPEGTVENQDQLWKDAPTSQLMDSKLKCVFESSPDNTQNVNLRRDENIKPVYNKELASTLPPSDSSVSEKKLAKSSSSSEAVDKAKLNRECETLNAEILRLKAENESLRNEGARLRKIALSQTVASTPDSLPSGQTGAIASVGAIPPVVYMVIVLVLGLLIGKLLS